MSFLVEDDQLATLEDALALIDACDVPGAAPTAVSSYTFSVDRLADVPDVSFDVLATDDGMLSPSPSPTSPALSASPAPSSATPPLRKKATQPQPKKVRSNTSAVARHRERKKAETQHLRDETAELEAVLAQLQHARKTRSSAVLYLLELQRAAESDAGGKQIMGPHRPSKAVTPKVVSAWLARAAFQAQERWKSEALNLKLKDAIVQQKHVIRSLQDILSRRTVMQGLDLLLDAQKEDLYTECLLAQEDRAFQELRNGLKPMYFAANALFDPKIWAEPVDSVSCLSQVKQDATSGTYVEVRSNTPLQTTFKVPAKMMWERMFNFTCSKDTSCHVKHRSLTDTSFQKCFTMFIDGPDGRRVELHGTSYVERLDEPRRVVWLWRSLLVSADSNGPQFLEQCWTVQENVGNSSSTTSSSNKLSAPRPASVFRTCYQASCDSRGHGATALDAKADALVESVLQTLGTRTRTFQQVQQNILLSEFSRPLSPGPTVQILA